jgi:serine/threonine protein kinase
LIEYVSITTESAKEMIEVGTVLQNRYRIEQQIGQGGMGKVYVATDERFKSTVAIKETVFEDVNLRKAFEREARLLNSLRHPALPRVSDHFNENDGQFLVMEYIAGEDLAEMMERNGKAFPLADVLKWANQLCDALVYLHAQDIIHRDIKPQNLKLTPAGQIVLLDFGLAKGNPTDAQHQTVAKSIFGYSRSYASLEQIQGTGTEPRSDLYSLSGTLYHLLTGIPPADALTRAMNVLNGQTDPLIAANLINNKVPAGVAAVLQTTMALNASERPESSASLRQMLEESDKVIDLSAANSVVTKPFTPELLTQNTKLFGAETNVDKPDQSQIETRISPANTTDKKTYKTQLSDSNQNSKFTDLIQPIGGSENKNSKRKVGFALFGGLVLIGSAFSAVYFNDSNLNEPNTDNKTVNKENKSSFVITAPANQNFEAMEETNVDSDLEEKESSTKPKDKQAIAKTTEKPKNTARQTKNLAINNKTAQSPKDSADSSDKITINGEIIEMGDLILDENGFRTKSAPGKPPTPPQPFVKLSPEQVEKLKRLNDKNSRVIIVKPTEPKPTP